jgi:phenylalanyl-tRNA synthetase alpha chain
MDDSENLIDDISTYQKDILSDIGSAHTEIALNIYRTEAIGKKGRLTKWLKGLGGMTADERQIVSPILNALKDEIAAAIEARKSALESDELEVRLATELVDVSLMPRAQAAGTIHPVSQVVDEITAIFGDMGFIVAEGPDIEDDFHNFTALNIPPEHPARQMHDTFYLSEPEDDSDQMLLRTHTSPVQIRSMMAGPPPHRLIIPGRTYRCDSDMTHTPMFHQVEGLVIDRDIHMGHLKGCLQEFARAFFEVDNLRVRFRPSHFPFTEPSAEMDIGCNRQGGKMVIGDGDDWLEILGSGMVHPNVLRHCGLDPDEWQGFAFGMGIDRIAMLKYGIPDLRAFFESDLRWLRHYGFSALDLPTLAGGLAR